MAKDKFSNKTKVYKLLKDSGVEFKCVSTEDGTFYVVYLDNDNYTVAYVSDLNELDLSQNTDVENLSTLEDLSNWLESVKQF